jgi:hypothetical protein
MEETMKALIALLPILFVTTALAGDPPAGAASAADAAPAMHRYLIERTFPAGALDGLDAETKARVNANNSSVGVSWIKSFANGDKTRTYCIYEGPSEEAIRKAAELNNLPVDSVTEVPVDLTP